MSLDQSIQKINFLKPAPFELYLPTGTPPFPLICITPMLGRFAFLDDLFFERQFARFFSSNGLATVVIDRPIFEFDPERGLEQVQEHLDESLRRNRLVLDFLYERKEIDRDRIGTYGMSFGAVVNSLWAAEDRRLKAHVFALGGGNLPEIFLTSRDPLMRSCLKAAIQKSGLKGEDLLAALKKVFRQDPLEAARSIPGENVCLHLALFDRVIRFRYGLALREALGKPETVFIPLGHYSSILAIPFLRPGTLGFFRRKLS